MNPGELDRRILIQTPTRSQDADTGEVTEGFSDFGERWAKFEPVSEDELLEDGARIWFSVVKFTIRYERINEKYRVKYNNKTYNINGIKETERRRYLELECESRGITNFNT